MDSVKLIGGGRPFKKRGSTSRSSETNARNKRKKDAYRVADSDCDSIKFDADESDTNAPSSKSDLSTQDSKASSRGRGRQKKQKRGPVPGKKELGK